MKNFSEIQQKILNRIQRDFPLVPYPFRKLAEEIGIDESLLLAEVQKLKDEGVIRNISGIFEGEALGYISALVAFEVEDIEYAKAIINDHPGVSHNYLRNHKLNMWFTLSLPNEWDFNAIVHKLAKNAKALDYIILPTVKRFKLGVHFIFGDEPDAHPFDANSNVCQKNRAFTIAEKEAIKLLQKDIPIESAPFRAILKLHNGKINETMLLDIGNSLKKSGVLRRYCAVVRHHKAGYSANAMTAWKIDESKFEAIEAIFATNPHISHLFIRQTIPKKWEYPLFAMVHAKCDKELSAIIENLSLTSGITDFCVLKTVEELKKERVEYFSEKFENWKNKYD